MSDSYRQLLEATIQHVEGLKERGVRHVAVAPETLRALAHPAAKILISHFQSPTEGQLPSPVPRSSRREEFQTIQPTFQAAAVEPETRKSQSLLSSAATIVAAAPLDPQAKAAAFAALRERALACMKCPNLASSRKQVVFGVGNIDSPLMLVGEAPGADEDAQGEPFVGAAGQLLTKIINATGLSRADVYIANILKCRPDTPGQSAGNRKPTPAEMATCIPFLHEQIDLIRPKVIIALGATAVEGLLGKTVGITKLRGNWQTYRGTPLMPTYHPAYLLRNQSLSTKREVWEDMLAAMEKLGMPISEKQWNFFLKA
jgi:DNA polymerase